MDLLEATFFLKLSRSGEREGEDPNKFLDKVQSSGWGVNTWAENCTQVTMKRFWIIF